MSIKMSRLATIWSEVLGANKRIYSTIPVSLAKVWWVCPLLFSDSFTFWHVRIVYYQGEKGGVP